MYPHPSPSSSRSSSRSNSFSTPDLACLDNPCQVSFEVRHSPNYHSRYRSNILDCIILQKGDPCWVRIDGKWYVGLIISSSYLRQPAVSLCYLFRHLSNLFLASCQPFSQHVLSWDVALLPNAHGELHRSTFSPLLGHLKPANNAILSLLQAGGFVPYTWVHGSWDIESQVLEIRKLMRIRA